MKPCSVKLQYVVVTIDTLKPSPPGEMGEIRNNEKLDIKSVRTPYAGRKLGSL